jgi:hypothetical protein
LLSLIDHICPLLFEFSSVVRHTTSVESYVKSVACEWQFHDVFTLLSLRSQLSRTHYAYGVVSFSGHLAGQQLREGGRSGADAREYAVNVSAAVARTNETRWETRSAQSAIQQMRYEQFSAEIDGAC